MVDAYLGQQGGDTVKINVNGQPDVDSTTTQGTSDSVKLYIPHGLLIPGIVNLLTYTVMRGSLNAGTSQPPIEILYNKEGPGEQDVTPGDGANSSLKLFLPKEITDGVGPGFIKATVCVEYAWCRAYDRIRLNCNGHDVYRTVTILEAPAPPSHGSPIPTRICFEVTSADLKDDPDFKFSFTVNDQIENGPDSDAVWSAVETEDVDQAGLKLAPLIPREILSDTIDDPGIISLKKLGSSPLSLIVLTQDSRFKKGDMIKAQYLTEKPGLPDVVTETTGVVEEDELGQKKACVLQIENHKVMPDSRARMSYKLFRNGVLEGTSRTATAVVEPFVPLTVDTSLLRLHGVMVTGSYLGTLNGVDAEDNTARRLPEGGVKPYTFRSTSVAVKVDADGKVTGMENGVCDIVIRDSVGAEVRYSVSVRNIYSHWVYHSDRPWTYAKYITWQNQKGYLGLTPTLLAVLKRCYNFPFFGGVSPEYPTAWTGAAVGEVYNYVSKTFYTVDPNSDQSFGLGFYRRPDVTDAMGSMGTVQNDIDPSITTAPLPE
ncbi:hypothetical protein [Pseudomonas sp. TWP3-1]|uniref:hypothetical protein n=1 Tax=Pseudomonas sp. TWP3-1 TaxID=2804631 RepID=UPI003CF1AC17